MITAQFLTGKPVELLEMLDARSARALRQKELLAMDPKSRSLISFSMNIAGEYKSFPLVLEAFDEALLAIRKSLSEDEILWFEEARPHTGPQAFFLLTSEPAALKRAMTAIEESHPLGRLFDIDVLKQDGLSVSRKELGLPRRTCLICGAEAKSCARSRNHTLEMITWRTVQILSDFFRNRAADRAASCAVRALLYEVSATPKPGLVDRNNSGSHNDMNFFTFLDSSAALIPWFRDFFCIGWDHADETDARLFSRLRYAGLQAERHMFAATKGVNTHKGLIFSFAVLCGALGRLSLGRKIPFTMTALLEECKKLGACSLEDFQGQTASGTDATAGERCRLLYGIFGARGEAAAGFPSVCTIGLPALKRWLSEGFSLNDAAVLTILSLLTSLDDTNMIHRGGKSLAEQKKKEAAEILSNITAAQFQETLSALDRSYIQENLSPGGCADLLAVSLLLYFLEENAMVCE